MAVTRVIYTTYDGMGKRKCWGAKGDRMRGRSSMRREYVCSGRSSL